MIPVKTLLKYWREAAIVILVIIISISVKTCKRKESDISVLSLKADSVRHYKLKNGEMAAQIVTNELTMSQLKHYGIELGFDNNALKKQIGSLNRLVSYWQGKVSVRDTIHAILRDTTYIEKGVSVTESDFNWHNKYLIVNGKVIKPNIEIDYKYSVDFTLTSYRKDKTFFRRGTLVSDVVFSDPQLTTTQFKGLVIKEEPKRWYETKGFAFGLGMALGTFGVIKLSK